MNDLSEPGITQTLATPPRSLIAAVRRLLRPLVKLLLNYSVQYPALTSLLKQTYVEVATAMPVEGKIQTDSRVSLLTGIHRLDVKRLRNEIVSGSQCRCQLARKSWRAGPRTPNTSTTKAARCRCTGSPARADS